ncbi:MAG: hypothetical protein PHO83_12815 [Geobacteraceae bacterium]|nr:hypothetical protein [Geobacteraceae bacterium]
MGTKGKVILVCAVVGLLLGGFVGYLYRPPAFLIGQLPFKAVITRGGSLQGLDQLYLSTARTSFNYLLSGGIIGMVLGTAAGFLLSKGKTADSGCK